VAAGGHHHPGDRSRGRAALIHFLARMIEGNRSAGAARPAPVAARGENDTPHVSCLRRSTCNGELASLLPGGGSSTGEPAGHGVDRSPADHGLGQSQVAFAFVVPRQAAVRGERGEGTHDRLPWPWPQGRHCAGVDDQRLRSHSWKALPNLHRPPMALDKPHPRCSGAPLSRSTHPDGSPRREGRGLGSGS